MMMVTGTLVPRDGDNAPTIKDVAIHLGREFRFGNAVQRWWTGLHHAFTVDTIISDMLTDKRRAYRDSVRAYGLVHDAHEAITRDIPTPWKTKDGKEIERSLDIRIRRSWGMPDPPDSYLKIIKQADYRSLLAEGAVVGPPGWMDAYRKQCGGKLPAEWAENLKQDIQIVKTIAENYPGWYSTFPPDSPGALEYEGILTEILNRYFRGK